VKIPTEVAEFREILKRKRVPRYYSGVLHFAFTAVMSLGTVAYCVLHLEDVRTMEWLTLPATFIYANLTEYFAHRGPMHHPRRGLRIVFVGHTLNHHHYFTHEAMELQETRDVATILFPPVMLVFFFGLFGFPVAFLLGLLVSSNTGYLFFAVAMAYYLNYEIFHLAYHMPQNSWVGRLPLMSRLRQYHTRHHDLQLMSRYCFNITYPIGDFIFGTSAPRPAASLRSTIK